MLWVERYSQKHRPSTAALMGIYRMVDLRDILEHEAEVTRQLLEADAGGGGGAAQRKSFMSALRSAMDALSFPCTNGASAFVLVLCWLQPLKSKKNQGKRWLLRKILRDRHVCHRTSGS